MPSEPRPSSSSTLGPPGRASESGGRDRGTPDPGDPHLRVRDRESARLIQDARRRKNWKRWGPYLSDRQWGTVREDYSPDGSVWGYFPHDHARFRAYRWGEDGLLGWCDRQARLCFSFALWNGVDPILKERLFGLSGPRGSHGEDVKEHYYHLDSTPTHSYCRAAYHYPVVEYPYQRLIDENRGRAKDKGEFEIADTGVFDAGWFEVTAEYAKADADDVLILLTVKNASSERRDLTLLPTLWFRNTWSWGCQHEGCLREPPSLRATGEDRIEADHPTLGRFVWEAESPDTLIFTNNETNHARLGCQTRGECVDDPHRSFDGYAKDAFHAYVVHGRKDVVHPERLGTKAAGVYRRSIAAGETTSVRLRLRPQAGAKRSAFGRSFDKTFADRRRECDAYHDLVLPNGLKDAERLVARRAYAGLLWTKQFYHYAVGPWIDGDPKQPAPPPGRAENARNRDWRHLFNRDILSMPDKWEYPWFAAWDTAFHMIPFARIDPHFTKQQLLLFLREWYLHPNGQIPAYEFNFNDVNPPVHAWACWRVYKMTGPRGQRDRAFLARCFQKLVLNFTWWVNRKDASGRHLFGGGFLGLDNIGLFDRSHGLPRGVELEQADGTAWMAFYCAIMLTMALELADGDAAYEDMASKFFEHFVAITDAINSFGGSGLWDEDDGFYYDRLCHHDGRAEPLRVRSMVGVVPLFAIDVLEDARLERLKGFRKRMQWFLDHRPDLARHVIKGDDHNGGARWLLAVPSRARLERVLKYVLDEAEMLSPYGVRSLSRAHGEKPVTLQLNGTNMGVAYEPAESTTDLFGGNSNWRGPVWFPLNYLLIEALERYHHFYGDAFRIEHPTGSGRMMTLQEVADDLGQRLVRLFLPDSAGRRPCHGDDADYAADGRKGDALLFYEYFQAETGRGLGASHQTGWTALVAELIDRHARHQSGRDGQSVEARHPEPLTPDDEHAERAVRLSPHELSDDTTRGD